MQVLLTVFLIAPCISFGNLVLLQILFSLIIYVICDILFQDNLEISLKQKGRVLTQFFETFYPTTL